LAKAVITSLSSLLFARNRATNLYPLVFGLFLKIEGASNQTINCLGNAGQSVSLWTIDCICQQLTETSKQDAIDIIRGADPCFVLYDNVATISFVRTCS
jgi:hypothetical protein